MMAPRLQLIVSCAMIVAHVSAQTTLSITTFGATPNDATNDTQAIQATIDAVYAAGGGTVLIPAGTFLIRPVADPDPIQTIALRLKSNITLQGAGRDASMLRIMDGAIAYDALIGAYPSYSACNNVALLDLTVNGNALNNLVTGEQDLNDNGSRTMLRLYISTGVVVERCRFTDHQGIWVLAFNGLMEDVLVRDNLFALIGDDTTDWDHSTIYTNGARFTITDNTFSTRYGAGTLGARTAIETHGEDQLVARNTIQGYPYGMNITGYSNLYLSRRQVIADNTLTGMMEGLVLWSGASSDPDFSNGLDSVAITGNTIELDPDAYINYPYFNGGGGIVFYSEQERPIRDLWITGNTIRFVNSLPITGTESRKCSGLRIPSNTATQPAEVRRMLVYHNRIEGSYGPAFYLARRLNDAAFVANTVINAGGSDTVIFNAFRSGFFLGDTLLNAQISCNSFTDNFSPHRLARMVVDYGYNAGSCAAFGSTSNVNGLAPFTTTNDASGVAWDLVGARPQVSFTVDSISVAEGTSASVQVLLDRTWPTDITVPVILIETDDLFNDDLNAPQSVTIPAGQTQIAFNVQGLFDMSTEVNERAWLMLGVGIEHHVGCRAALRVGIMSGISTTIRPAARVFLQGPFNTVDGRMRDDLRIAGLIPATEPYSALGYTYINNNSAALTAGALTVTGNNAIVDWVVLELRSDSHATQVIASRPALLQRDGDVVDTDGLSAPGFLVPFGTYRLAVRHRNHLGVLTANGYAFANAALPIDFSMNTTLTYGTNAQGVASTGQRVLWSGNVLRDITLKYTGASNDRDPILTMIGGTVPTNTANGYLLEDVNLDGVVKYTGANNDRDQILTNIGGTVPTNTRTEQLP